MTVGTTVLRGRLVPKGVVAKRVATAAVAIPLVVWVVAAAPVWLFHVVVIGLAGLAVWELVRAFARAGRPVPARLSVAATLVVAASFAVPGGPAVALTLAVGAILGARVLGAEAPSVEPALVALLGVTYVGWLLGHAVLLRRLGDGAELVLFLLGVTWTGESAAYVVGSMVGRHRLAPVISPRKTVEGAAAQLVLSVVAAGALGAWLLPWPLTRALVAGGLLGIVGQVGDLAESVMKRSLGTKDMGGLIPGHGGVLDRIDGLLFNVPVLYYYAVYAAGSA